MATALLIDRAIGGGRGLSLFVKRGQASGLDDVRTFTKIHQICDDYSSNLRQSYKIITTVTWLAFLSYCSLTPLKLYQLVGLRTAKKLTMQFIFRIHNLLNAPNSTFSTQLYSLHYQGVLLILHLQFHWNPRHQLFRTSWNMFECLVVYIFTFFQLLLKSLVKIWDRCFLIILCGSCHALKKMRFFFYIVTLHCNLI